MYLIVDGTNLAHRARHAYQLSTVTGKSVSVTYGVMRMLVAMIKSHKPSSVIFCWDGGTPGFRKRLMPGYKAGRKAVRDKDPDWSVFVDQLSELENILPFTGIFQVRRKGIEADDLIAQAARMSVEDNIIISTDEDMLQCVSNVTSVLCPSTKKGDQLYTTGNFEELMGIPVFQYLAYKVLQGDSSDNVRGVRGIGPVTAKKILMNTGKVQQTTRVKMEQFIENGDYNRSYTVMDLAPDRSGARFVLTTAEWQPYSKKVMQWCMKLGFTSLIEAGSLGSIFGKLKKPEFSGLIPIPRIWDYERYPKVNPLYDGQEIEV